MNRQIRLFLGILFATTIVSCTRSANQGDVLAPPPAKSVDLDKFYTGRWYEIARTPMSLTDGCVAGTTDYYRRPDGQLMDRDACRKGSPAGEEKVYEGPVTILNAGENTKVSVRYTVFYIFSTSRTYWMLDHDNAYTWFIVSDPTFKNLSIFTRTAQPSKGEIAQLVGFSQAIGYDTNKLEFPTQFPAARQ